MDPLSHASFGRLLVGAAGARERVGGAPLRGTVAAAMLGALSPDLDSVFMPFGWDRYLRVHEIGTHTLVGTLACALLTAAVVRWFTRTPDGPLAAAAWLGASSHVLLDLLSSARLRPAWPVVDRVVSLPAVAMADPWFLSLCFGGAIAAKFARGTRAPRTMVAAIAVFLLAKAALGLVAFGDYTAARDRAGEPVSARAIEAEWASLTGWRVLDRTPRALRAWRVRAGENARIVLTWPHEDDSAVVAASRRLSTVANFLRAHELVFAGTIPGDEGRVLVLWSDIRFCWDPSPPGAPQLDPMLRSRDGQRIACALWFGGEFDAGGAPVREIVKIAGFTQSR